MSLSSVEHLYMLKCEENATVTFAWHPLTRTPSFGNKGHKKTKVWISIGKKIHFFSNGEMPLFLLIDLPKCFCSACDNTRWSEMLHQDFVLGYYVVKDRKVC